MPLRMLWLARSGLHNLMLPGIINPASQRTIHSSLSDSGFRGLCELLILQNGWPVLSLEIIVRKQNLSSVTLFRDATGDLISNLFVYFDFRLVVTLNKFILIMSFLSTEDVMFMRSDILPAWFVGECSPEVDWDHIRQIRSNPDVSVIPKEPSPHLATRSHPRWPCLLCERTFKSAVAVHCHVPSAHGRCDEFFRKTPIFFTRCVVCC